MTTEKGGDCSRRPFTRKQGFTLIELAIIIVISGFIMASFSTGMAMYRKQAVLDKTYNNIDAIALAVDQIFTPLGNRYLRPAGRNLDSTDPDYGIEISAADAAALVVDGPCSPSMVCKVSGARDADGDLSPDPVLIGSVPVRSMRNELLGFAAGGLVAGLNVTKSASYDANLDGWGRMFTYAVTESLTDTATYEDLNGAIAVETENGGNLLREPGSAHVVFVSHGPDGKGGYTPEGKLYKACTATPGKDQGNCDGTSTFINGLTSLGRNADYFDDTMRFRMRGTSTIWKPGMVGSSIYNTNPGRVGIGTDTPTERLHIVGDIQAGKARADSYCDSTGADCLLPATIGGAGINCSGGNSMTGISFNGADCAADPTSPVLLTSCPPGELLIGVNADGSLDCGTL